MRTSYSLFELAEQFQLQLHGDGQRQIDGVGTLADANASQLAFLSNRKYTAQLAKTRAAVVILSAGDLAACPTAALVAEDPYVAYARIAALFERVPLATPGIHPGAVVAHSAQVSASASIGPGCVLGERVSIGAGVVLGPLCIIGDDCSIGDGSRLVARVTLVTRVHVGCRVLIHPGAVLGADGFGLAFDRDHWIKLPQLGGVRIGDDCEIGANTTIDRGALEDTVLEEDVRLDNQIQIAHNVHIGAHTAMAGCRRRQRQDWALLHDRRQRRRARPSATGRPRYHYRQEPGDAFHSRARRIFLWGATTGQSAMAQERHPLQAFGRVCAPPVGAREGQRQ
jgi:UDP-3-O-[3-hydroxymyristoyl] glucosamine N-acyltransferase